MDCRYKPSIIMCGIGFIVVLLNIELTEVLFYDKSLLQQSLNDFFIVLITGLIGYNLSDKVKLPKWWHDKNNDFKKSAIIIGIIGLIIVAGNTLINILMFTSYREELLERESWIALLTPLTSILVSLRAAIMEEIIFRFFMITTITWALKFFISSERSNLTIAIILSSIIFGLIHSTFLVPLAFGLLLSYTYINYGLIPVLIIHFVANLIPFTLYTII